MEIAMISVTDVRKHYRFAPEAVEVVTIHDAAGLSCRLVCFEPRQTLAGEAAGDLAEVVYVLEGTGVFESAGQPVHVSAGGLLSRDRGEGLSINNPGPGRLVVMMVSAS
jgi:quercetin dioxygenase-like cupin family protein